MHKVIIDRIEEDRVVCIAEGGSELVIPLNMMPDGVGEGDVVYVMISKDVQETVVQKADAKELLNELLSS